jgi:Enoyl-CoA hydratase/carnithine racemase
MSKYSCFDVKTKDHICSLVFNRPNELNTMTPDFWVELGNVFKEINKNFG